LRAIFYKLNRFGDEATRQCAGLKDMAGSCETAPKIKTEIGALQRDVAVAIAPPAKKCGDVGEWLKPTVC
jgi:hypothetical protein